MSNSNYNKIISTINSVSSNYSYLPDPNNLICIDTSNNRIGINTLNPSYSIDVSDGTIKAKNVLITDSILGTNDKLELYTNTNSSDSYGFIELGSSKCTIGGPNLEFYVNSSDTSFGNCIINAESNGVAINKGANAPTHTLEVNGDCKINGNCELGQGIINQHFGGGGFVLSHKNNVSNSGYGLFLHSGTGQTVLNSPTGSFTALANSNKYNLRVYNDHIRVGATDYDNLNLNNVAVSINAADIGRSDGVGFSTEHDGNWILIFYNSAKSDHKGKIRGVNPFQVAYDTTSDRRLKENITPMPSMLEKIKQLKPVYYTWKKDGNKGDGFIAQEVHKVLPQLRDYNCWDKCKCGMTFNDAWDGKTCKCVDCDVENPKNTFGNDYTFGLDYGKFTPYIVKAMQEQQVIIEKQETLIQSLVSRIEALENVK